MDGKERQEFFSGLYRKALLAELQAQDAANDARSDLKVEEASLVQQGYDNGDIGGKNQAERDRAELLYLAGVYPDKQCATLIEAEHQLALATIERKVVEASIGLEKARLYSQARIG